MSKKNLPKPAGYRLLLKPREIENKTAGGITPHSFILFLFPSAASPQVQFSLIQ